MKKLKTIKLVIVIIAVVCIPIMYSFFYLKSYWDPYGRLKNMTIAMVNLDEGQDGENLGQEFVDSLIEKDVVEIRQVEQDEAERGLIEEDYFAVITIPKTFTEYLNSASSTDKHVATITYSPNQKYNYLASQIINKVVTTAETTLESEVSEKVVETLSNNLEEIPDKLNEINDGVAQIGDGTEALSEGLNEINNGVGTLQDNYGEFNNGVKSAYEGGKTLTNGISQVNSGVSTLSSGSDQLDTAMTQINTGADTLSSSAEAGITELTDGMSQLSSGATQVADGTSALVAGTAADSTLGSGAAQVASGASQVASGTSAIVSATSSSSDLAQGAAGVSSGISAYVDTVNAVLAQAGISNPTLQATGEALKAGSAGVSSGISTLNTQAQTLNAGAQAVSTGAQAISSGIGTLNTQAQALNAGAQAVSTGAAKLASADTAKSLNELVTGIGTLKNALAQVKSGTTSLKSGVTTLSTGTKQLQSGSQTLTDGLETLSNGSTKINDALSTLKDGTQSAYDGSIELKDGVKQLQDGITDGITEADEQLLKLDGLSDFVKDSVKIEEVDYGEIEAYGTAFTPLFISVGLWVGALMTYVVFYYDQEKRFKILGKQAKNKYLQCFCYFGIAIIQALVTGFLLDLGLDMDVTNYGLYYGSCILISITFMSIIQFFILNFGEVGKFVGLLVLVLQLAASGGTFPVALIDESFQKLTPYLPMTYTIRLTKEAVILQKDGNASHDIGIMMGYTIVCLAITFIIQKCKAIYEKKKNDNKKTTEVD